LEEVFFISLCVALGLGSGFIGGLLGIGGGVVIVPTLVLAYDFGGRFPVETNLLVAVATSLACIVFTSASAAYTQYRAGKVLWALFRKLVAFLLLGSFAAGFVATWLPPEVFRGFIGGFLAFVAVVMLSNWQPHPHRQFPGNLGSAGIGFGGGMAAGLAGIAGGNVIVPTLVYFNTPIHNATATSSALGVPIAVSGTVGYLLAAPPSTTAGLIGYVDIYAFTPIVFGALIAAPMGVKVAHRVPASKLKRGFGVLLVFVSARMLWSIF
jgi:uncharacterized protein